MYQAHFGLSQLPFALTPNTAFFCDLDSHREALNTLLVALSQGEGLILISGEVGSGKTLLCRLLLNTLHGKRPYAYIANADLTADGLRQALADELGVGSRDHTPLPAHELQRRIERQLLALAQSGTSVVWVIDEAQAMPRATLETLRLFSNLESEQRKLLQIVLFAQPELDRRLAQHDLRQLRQRIAFSYRLRPLRASETRAYLQHRLQVAGHASGSGSGAEVFGALAATVLHVYASGTPRLINLLAHKSLMLAAAQQRPQVSLRDVLIAAFDTDATRTLAVVARRLLAGTLTVIAAVSVAWAWSQGT